MKLISALLLAVALAVQPVVNVGCQTPPEQRAVVFQTLKAVKITAEGAVSLSAELYRDGKITAAQARQITDFYNEHFYRHGSPFHVAVLAARSNLDSFASPDIAALAGQLIALVASFQKQNP